VTPNALATRAVHAAAPKRILMTAQPTGTPDVRRKFCLGASLR
jgi:hypothetical protein